ncbi:MAG: GreA/GreB family elongation factor, partial [Candidatus Moraniibacteriota bacterium]
KNNGNGCVGVGCTVSLVRENGQEKVNLEIVGTHEVNPAAGKISHESPLGGAIIGKKKGEKVEVETPNGKEQYEIKEVK